VARRAVSTSDAVDPRPPVGGNTMITSLLAAAPHAAELADGRWGGPGHHGGGYLLAPLILLFWVLLAVLVAGLLRRSGRGPWQPASASAEGVLGDRFARGDIDEEEYRARLEVLRAARKR
jgi:putative membrane protein